MVGQAQHPSNVLLLNRNEQEQKNVMLGGDCLLQSPQAGRRVHESVFVDSEGVFNPRKRGREAADLKTGAPINLSSRFQSFGNVSHQSGVYAGLRLSFKNELQKQQPTALLLSSDLSSQIKQQSDEIDQLLKAQGEQLRYTLAERQQRHYRALLCAAEETATAMLREKCGEIEKAMLRKAELELMAAKLKAEARLWEAKTREQQAEEALLKAKLREAMVAGRAAQDKGGEIGCAVGDTVPADDAESACIDPRRHVSVSGVPVCRACRKRYVSMVLLPCRHLCVCAACKSDVRRCPLCHSDVTASVEAYLS